LQLSILIMFSGIEDVNISFLHMSWLNRFESPKKYDELIPNGESSCMWYSKLERKIITYDYCWTQLQWWQLKIFLQVRNLIKRLNHFSTYTLKFTLPQNRIVKFLWLNLVSWLIKGLLTQIVFPLLIALVIIYHFLIVLLTKVIDFVHKFFMLFLVPL